MKILFLGDIFGRPGRQILRNQLPALVGRQEIDLIVANGENASGGLGLDTDEALELFDLGIAVLTGGNHTFRFKNIEKLMREDNRILRPANYPDPCPGQGWTLVESPGGRKIAVGNLMGRVFLNQTLDCPFKTADRLIEEIKEAGAEISIFDFHAEATSEKKALASYLDGRVGAVLGTHTHIQTADAQIMPGGTAYITDAGMCGPHNSIIGMSKESVMPSFLSGRTQRFEPASKGARLNGVILYFNSDGKAEKIQALDIASTAKSAAT